MLVLKCCFLMELEAEKLETTVIIFCVVFEKISIEIPKSFAFFRFFSKPINLICTSKKCWKVANKNRLRTWLLFWSSSALRNSPVYVFRGHFNGAAFAMYAILRVYHECWFIRFLNRHGERTILEKKFYLRLADIHKLSRDRTASLELHMSALTRSLGYASARV